MEQERTSNFPTFEEFRRLPDDDDPKEFRITLPEIKGRLRTLKMGQVYLSDGAMELSGTAVGKGSIRHFNDLPLVEMNFVLDGHIRQRVGHIKEDIAYKKGYHNLMYNRGEWEQNTCMTGGLHNTFTVNVLEDRFVELFSGHSAELAVLGEKVVRKTPFLMDRPGQDVTPAMRSIIDSLWACPLRGALKSLFLEARTMDLLLLQWDRFTGARKTPGVLRSKADMDRIHQAREVLSLNLDRPPTLAQLARLCGLNEFKLKKGFKEVFSDTVYGYVGNARLEQARLLILDTDRTITDIALATGYAHAQHFHRAFKKKYGLAPGQLRK